jgi:hypothetical protein
VERAQRGPRPSVRLVIRGTGFHPVWITVRHFHVGLVLSRVVPIFYVLFAPAGFFFAKPLFTIFFVTSRDILQKKTDRQFFSHARLRVASNLYKVCYKQLQHLLFSSRPHFRRQPTRIQGSASAAESIPYLEGGSARTQSWVGLVGVSA